MCTYAGCRNLGSSNMLIIEDFDLCFHLSIMSKDRSPLLMLWNLTGRTLDGPSGKQP